MNRIEHTSRLAARWMAEGAVTGWRQVDGTAVLADLTGFTRLTESLAGHGAEGAEVLHRALTLSFAALLEPSLRAGGDIIGFAGDAALVWFDGADHETRAADSALAMPESLSRLPAALTGGKRLRVSVGVHTGKITVILTGGRQQGLFLCGPEISHLVTLEAAAAPGQVMASAALAARLPLGWRSVATGPGIQITRRDRGRITTGTPGPLDAQAVVDPDTAQRCLSLLSPAVRTVMTSDLPTGDHRSASIGFVAVPGLDALLATGGPAAVHATLEEVTGLVDAVTSELGVAWLDVDVAAGGVKLMLAAGAPDALDDDESRLLLALRRILDESSLPLRAGAQRGRVFAGALGVPGRRTFTVLGDAVNVAARALGFAGDRELVAGDGLGLADRRQVDAVDLGQMTLRSRTRPVRMWRVTAVSTNARADVHHDAATVTGRANESEAIASAWKDAVGGAGGWLTIVGEPGMGASELLAEAVARADTAATLVVADPYRQQVPYATIAAVVCSLATGAGADEPDGGITWLTSFASGLDSDSRRWVDDGVRALLHRPRLDEVDPVTTARRARFALAALIERAAPRPWLLAVDGLTASDDASQLVLTELCNATQRQPWLVLTGSTGVVDAERTDDSAHTIVLEPLGEPAATALVLDVQPRLRSDQVARIVVAARGNPFVLTELARHPQTNDLPDSLERLGAARIDALSASARRLAREVSTFGSAVSILTVAEVLDRPELADREAWADTLTVLRFIEPETLAFRHEAYRVAAHQSLAFLRRRELHNAIADHLAAQPNPNPAVLARHYEEAGRSREAFPLAVSAGREAKAAGALVEAADLLDRAARLARDVDRPALGGLLTEQGETLIRLGDLGAAARVLAAAARAVRDPLDYALVCSHRAHLEMRRGRHRQARNWVRKGLTLVGPLGDRSLEARGRLLVDEVAALHFLARNTDALPVAREGLAAAQSGGNRYLEGLAHLHLEMVLSALLDPEAIEHGDAAIGLFEEIGHDRQLGVALINSGLTAMHAGRWDDALARYRRAAAVTARTGDVLDAAITELNEGFLLLRQGRFAAADERAARSMRTFDAAGLETHGAYARHLRSGIASAEGRFTEAEEQMVAARATFHRLGDHAMMIDCD
ncbi:MAG: AAA family ATPase, partial [Ilumatobacteraceae bacterium]